jgi:ABC-type glycerol-3-phosphate transport system substrate-binding protein
VPKKAVVIYLLLALAGAALFVYFTFPRTRDEIPQSNNQRPFPSSPGPNGVPVPENVPHPTVPATPHGPSLRVMAWANAQELPALQAEADAFEAAQGGRVSLMVEGSEADYRRDLFQALISNTPPDVCLVSARDFSGLDPARDLTVATPPGNVAPRSLAAFTVAGRLWAVPDEFSVDLLFYNSRQFDRAGIAYPDRHWTWDIMEAITRALASLQLKDESGAAIYPLELPANFDFWNILCTQAGHPALERDRWHLTENESRDSQVRGLDLIHEFFHDLAVTAPPPGPRQVPGRYFARQRASLLIAPSEIAASLPDFPHGMTLLPSDLSRASLARVNGWAVTTRSAQPGEAAALAQFLAAQPLHAGWSQVQPPADGTNAICYEALQQSLLPRLEPKTARLAQLLDQQINLFATSSDAGTAENFYAQIQAEYRAGYAPPVPAGPAFHPKTDTPQIRGL